MEFHMILAAVMGWFRTNPRNVWLIAGLIAAVLFLLWVRHTGVEHQRKKDEAARQVEIAAAINSDAKADKKSADQLINDAKRIAQDKEALVNVIAAQEDGAPDAASVVAGCELLRQYGRRTADIPACRALTAGGGTHAH